MHTSQSRHFYLVLVRNDHDQSRTRRRNHNHSSPWDSKETVVWQMYKHNSDLSVRLQHIKYGKTLCMHGFRVAISLPSKGFAGAVSTTDLHECRSQGNLHAFITCRVHVSIVAVRWKCVSACVQLLIPSSWLYVTTGSSSVKSENGEAGKYCDLVILWTPESPLTDTCWHTRKWHRAHANASDDMLIAFLLSARTVHVIHFAGSPLAPILKAISV